MLDCNMQKLEYQVEYQVGKPRPRSIVLFVNLVSFADVLKYSSKSLTFFQEHLLNRAAHSIPLFP